MKHYFDILSRQYRLGLCATLLIVDLVLVAIFFADLYRYSRSGYVLGPVRMEWMGYGIRHSWLHVAMMLLFLILLAPICVASVRVFATWLKLPATRWAPVTFVASHILLSLLIATLVLCSVHMRLAAGRKAAVATPNKYGAAFTATTEWLPRELESGISSIPEYVKSPSFLLKLFGVVIGLFAGRGILVRQREFLENYAAASRLTDFDASYLPFSAKARKVTRVRPSAPLSPAVEGAIHRALDAEQNLRHSPVKSSTRARNQLCEVFLGDPATAITVRFLPDVLSSIFTAISNESASSPILLSSQNHSGVNEFLQKWFGTSRSVTVVPDSGSGLAEWTVERETFLATLRAQLHPAAAPLIIVLPLVSKITGQIFEVRPLIADIRSWSGNVCVVLDASYLNVGKNLNISHLYGADYCCLNISQWISCSEPCGILITHGNLSPDADWENQPLFAPVNVRTISAFRTALEHAFKETQYFNDPLERTRLLLTKFHETIESKKITVVSIPDLGEWSYYLTVRPVAAKKWKPSLAERLRELGLLDVASPFAEDAALQLAFPPYVDYWQVDRMAALLNKSVV